MNTEGTTTEGSSINEKKLEFPDINVKEVMDQFKTDLERLYKEKESAIEDFLEKHAEEKFSQ